MAGHLLGVTYYNFTSNQFSGFHGIVIPGTLHDSPYVLDGLMENQSSLEPKQLMTDTAGYSDIVFALFWLLGFQFSPRLADIGESRFWRLDRAADYGALNGLASQFETDHAKLGRFLTGRRFHQDGDPCYRRDILTQLNRGEGRHRLSRKCFHGQRGELRQRYREGQEDQLGALGMAGG